MCFLTLKYLVGTCLCLCCDTRSLNMYILSLKDLLCNFIDVNVVFTQRLYRYTCVFRSALCHIPCLYVYPIIKSDFEKETSQNVPSPSASGHGSNRRTTPGLLSEQEMQDRRDKKALGIYNCPVYMNRVTF